MAKVIYFPPGHFVKSNQLPLTKAMITALKKGCDIQRQHLPLGQKEIDGSFGALISRGLIESQTTEVDGKSTTNWCVTKAAIDMLHDLGITDPC